MRNGSGGGGSGRTGSASRRRGREGNREMRLLKLVGAVAVRTMSKYRTRIEVDKFRKRCVVFPSPLDCFR